MEQNRGYVVEEDNVTLYIPNEIITSLFDAENPQDIAVGLNVNPVSAEDFEAGNLLTVDVTITVGDEAIERTPVPFAVAVSLEDFDLEGLNTYRLVAVAEDGTILGGKYDTETGQFVFETRTTGEFTIVYADNLIRLSLNLNSFLIIDLADNAPVQTMDVLPTIQNGRTLIPVRFVAEALGAEVDWTRGTHGRAAEGGDQPATDDRPTLVHITRAAWASSSPQGERPAMNGETLTFGIGEITPALAALGMDVPAQVIDGRTMVPLRFISEFFGAIVVWDSEARGIEIIMRPTSSGNSDADTSLLPQQA